MRKRQEEKEEEKEEAEEEEDAFFFSFKGGKETSKTWFRQIICVCLKVSKEKRLITSKPIKLLIFQQFKTNF